MVGNAEATSPIGTASRGRGGRASGASFDIYVFEMFIGQNGLYSLALL